jgi:LysM repeat protein
MTHDTNRPFKALMSLVVSSFLVTSIPVSAQTVAEAARQERERKQSATHARHVYTNEDLARPEILVPEDQSRVAGTAESAPTVAAATPASGSRADRTKALPLNARQVKPSGTSTPANAAVAAQRTVAASNAVPRPAMTLTVPVPVVNLPKQMVTATPFASPKENLSFPMLNGLTVSRVRASVPLSDVTAPAVPYAIPEMPVSSLNSIRPLMPAELNAAAPVMPIRRAETPLAPTISNTMNSNILVPALPLSSQPRPTSLPLPSELTASPGVGTAPERIATLPEAPMMLPSAAPVAEPAAFDTTQPVHPPAAPAVPVVKPMQTPARTPEESGVNTVLVQAGDSLWKLAARYLGKAERWVELAKLNPQLMNPSLIRPGETIHLPSLPKSAPVHENARTIVIHWGDTLWSVARVHLGQGQALSCIMHANPKIQSPDVIQAGETLVLPEDCAISR